MIFFSKFDLLVSNLVYETNPVYQYYLLQQLFHHTVCLTTSFFTTSLSLLKSTRTGTNLSIFNLSTFQLLC